MQTLEPIMAEHPFFRDLGTDHLHLLVGCATNVCFEPGQTIFREGEEANRFFLVRRGKVAIEVFVPGRGAVVIQTVGRGEILGWSWLVEPYLWQFDARALEDTRAIALDGRCLRGKCDANPRLGYEILKRFAHVMAERLQATRLQLLDVYGAQS
jgi:CRP/FNR family transcriptional regulator, cyclic AMP receptor protein